MFIPIIDKIQNVIPWPDGNRALVHMAQGNMTVNFKAVLFAQFKLDIGPGECLSPIIRPYWSLNLVWTEMIPFHWIMKEFDRGRLC